MDFRTTSIELRHRAGSAGFSIIETWFGLGLASILTAAVASFTLYTGKSFAGLSNYVELEQRSQLALDTMTKDIRQTQYLASFSTNELVFRDHDGQPLTYTYSPARHTLTRSKGGTNAVLLTECDLLVFDMFQRNPVEGTYDQYPVTTAVTNCKLISVTWVCSRQITGTKLNTESVQTAKIVIRKQ